MNKKLFAGLALAVIIVSGSFISPASALSVDEVQAQIRELLSKVAGLQDQLKRIGASAPAFPAPGAASTSSVLAKSRVCATLERNLVRGAAGDDVRDFQEFLREEGYFSGEATGYFGPLTAGALARWQVSQGIDGAGAVGPVTREKLRIRCGGGNEYRFSAEPQRGAAPLAVTFKTWLSGFRINTVSYTIDFGDGSSERAADCNAPADACVSAGENTHTYTQNGTYTATLNKITDPCAGQSACRAAIQTEVVAKLQIHVGQGPVACTKEYKPVCGAKPIVCITTPCDPVQQTYGNKCMAEADGARVIHEGACGSGANRPPVVSSFAGPTSLTLNETGTWRMTASDPENGPLSYSVTWGDEWDSTGQSRATSASASIVQETTFTHSYSRAGNYRVVVVVTDDSGKQTKASATVQVANAPVACTMEYAPVCGRPPGCADLCPPGQFCAAVCRLHEPQTYGNRCQLHAANAEFLYTGECAGAR